MIQAHTIELSASSKDLKKVGGTALIIGVGKSPDGPVLVDNPLPARATEALAGSLTSLGITGAADEVRRLPALPDLPHEVLVLTGLGKVDAKTGHARPSGESLRRAAGAAVRQLRGTKSVVLALPATSVAEATAVAEGAALGASSSPMNTAADVATSPDSADKHTGPVLSAVVVTPVASDKTLKAALRRASILGRAVDSTRALVNVPPNLLYPQTFTQAVRDLTKSLPVKVTVLDDKKLEKDGYGGLTGVGSGSEHPPRLVKVEYAPARAKTSLAIVGKGITFDSGGLSLKPAAGMMTMKCDMAGAATALNAVLAIAELGLDVKATAWLCLAENMPSGTATRPSDVITMYGGKTVEVLNTDAEGRLVMADGLAAASEESPDVLLDVATLTGAQMVALGARVSAVMGDDDVRDAVKVAADDAGELFWPMPIPEELRPTLDSQVADLANIGEKMGGMMTAAAFLHEFVGEAKGHKIPWGHLDIAGPAFNSNAAYGYTPKEGTGVAVRTLVQYAENASRS